MNYTGGTNAQADIRVKCRTRSGISADLRMLDLSAGGFMAECVGWSAQPGERILVTLPGLETQPGEMVWQEDGKVGVVFERPLHEVVLERFLQMLRPAAIAA